MNALEKAIQKAGSIRKLGAMIGVSGMAVSNWKTHCKGIVPANRVLAIHQVTGILPHDLRPDIYPNPTDALPAHREHAA
ncbi:transcriptional regulator [Symbiopectobacterium purcellii]|uniref:Helix-turn-helix domain-containing protein n=1 Tax=Symbiopectobacterium purcellii TaxID=2871826 RepID=A0ABX9AQ72_9ENTR|nr:YdaS family helix-turn-helix protein [Symbiopectobacterium purcellii]QZN97327.1 helix-turn-helix domain-containing protein [Symbiopectobacterium purcellii]